MDSKGLEDLIKNVSDLQRRDKEVDVVPGKLKISLSTLKYGEQLECMADIRSKSEMNNLEFIHESQISILSRATRTVNGDVMTVDQLKSLYRSMQFALVQQVYNEYADLIKEQQEALDALKKK